MNEPHPFDRSAPQPLRVPAIAKAAGAVWICCAALGIERSIGKLSIAMFEMPEGARLAVFPALAIAGCLWLALIGVQTIRGVERDISTLAVISFWCGLLCAALFLTLRYYDALPFPSAMTVAGAFALLARQDYLTYRRQRTAKGS